MSRKYKVFVLKGALNEATQYYIDIIREAIEASGHCFEITYHWRSIKRGDRIILIDAKTCFMMCILRPFNTKITWFQGVVPEEARMVFNSLWREALWRMFEFCTLRFSRFNFFVSKAMLSHYRQTYHYDKENYMIMPCFNSQMRSESFQYPGKYQSPSFVYAGNMNKWQCMDHTLQVFKHIERQIPDATLTLLTGDLKKARELSGKYELQNVSSFFCPLEKINEELAKYKYGFILREDNIVNNVATPTKMSTYLANGVIPVYSNVVEDFKQALKNIKNSLPIPSEKAADEIGDAIITFEKNTLQVPEDMISDFKTVFDTYFSRQHYITAITGRIRSLEEMSGA